MLGTLLPESRHPLDLPVFEEMPSIDLISVDSCIHTPRGFDEFTRDAKLSEAKLDRIADHYAGYFLNKRFVRANIIPRLVLPKMDWARHRSRYRTQVIRHNCTNAEYQRLVQDNKRKLAEFTDDVFEANSSSFGGKHENAVVPALWRRVWWEEEADGFPYTALTQGVYRTENLLSCFLALPLHFQMSLFEDQDFRSKGAYFVKLHKEGTWRYIMIDNLLPVMQGDISMLSGGFALTLLEKVWAKHLGKYTYLDQLESTKLGDILTDLTGAPSE